MPSPEEASTSTPPPTTFQDLGIIPPLLTALTRLKYTTPTNIQLESLPHALKGHDIIGVASTGSGKTAAFALPILQKLHEEQGRKAGIYACILAPTRELAFQISEQFDSLGGGVGVKCAVIIGGVDIMTQAVALAKKPDVVVATPGRLHWHLENTKGFSLRTIKFLVLDEADRLLDMDFGPVIESILKVVPKERTTYLFSATMSSKVAKLQRACLTDPVRVEVTEKYQTVSTLLQYYIFLGVKERDVYLIYLANSLVKKSIIVFTRTVSDAARISILLRTLGFPAIPLHGQMGQSERLDALGMFKSGGHRILVATDVASRGLDIPSVDIVINHDVPSHPKDYIHRVGRTARAGRPGSSITLVTQYDVELVQRIEAAVGGGDGKKMALWETDVNEVRLLEEKVNEAGRVAANEMKKDAGGKGKRKRENGYVAGGLDERDRDDDEVEAGVPNVKRKKGKAKR